MIWSLCPLRHHFGGVAKPPYVTCTLICDPILENHVMILSTQKICGKTVIIIFFLHI